MNEAALVASGHMLAVGRAEQAEEMARGLLAEWPDDWRAQRVLGCALLEQGKVRDADAALRLAATQQPENPEVLKPLAQARLSLGRAADAERLIAVVLSQKPDDVAALWLHCLILMRRKRRRQVFPALRRVLDTTPDPVFAHRAMAHVARWAGSPRTAEDHLRAALAIRPDDPALVRELAEVSGHRGPTQVRDLLVAAIRLDPGHRGAPAVLGVRTRAHVVTGAVLATGVYLLLAVGLEYLVGFPRGEWSSGLRGLDLLLGFAAFRLAQRRLWAAVPRDVRTVSRQATAPLLSVPLGCLLLAAASASSQVRSLGIFEAVVATASVQTIRDRPAKDAARRDVWTAAVALLGVAAGTGATAAATVHSQGPGAAALTAAGAGLAVIGVARVAVWRPLPPRIAAAPAGRWTTVTYAAAAWPERGVLFALAVPLLVLYFPLILAARLTRATRPDSRLRPLVFGGFMVLDGAVIAAILLAIMGARGALVAALVMVGFVINGVSQAAVARRRLLPSWMVFASGRVRPGRGKARCGDPMPPSAPRPAAS